MRLSGRITAAPTPSLPAAVSPNCSVLPSTSAEPQSDPMTNDTSDSTPHDPHAGVAPADASGQPIGPASPPMDAAGEPPPRSRARWIAAAGAALALALFAVPLLRGPDVHIPGAAGESARGPASGPSCAVNKGAA